MAGVNRIMLPVDAVLKIRDLYAERLPRTSEWRNPLPRYSQAEIAKLMDCSETTVFRVVNRLGGYAFIGGQSMGELKADPAADQASQAAAKASLERLQKLLTAQPVEDAPDPGAQLSPETQAAADAIKQKLGNL